MSGKIFFSYARADGTFALKLARELREKGLDLWIDQLDIPPGARWDRTVEDALKAAPVVLVILSPASVSSDNVLDEVGYALDHGRAIVPVLLSDCDVPLRLRRLQRIDFTADEAAALARCHDELRRLVPARTGSDPAGLTPGSAGEASPSPRPSRGEGGGEGQPQAPSLVAAPHPNPLPAVPATPGGERGRAPSHPPGAIPVIVGSGADDREQWIVPGSGKSVWFKDHAQGPEMVVVPAGEFMMGSPESEPEREPEYAGKEGQRRVTIAKPFAVSRCAVTRGEFAAFILSTGHKLPDEAWTFENEKFELRKGRSWRNPNFAQDDRHPVVCINWDDAKAYAAWLAATTGKPYRLPSEAEWEYAARAGTSTPFWWGRSITPEQANYDGTFVYAGGGGRGANRKATLPVDYAGESFAANPWGLHQVHGNVWEWCEDCWNETLPPSPADGSALTVGDCSRRVARGGSWYNVPWGLRAAYRGGGGPVNRFNYLGFRVARSLA